VSFTCNLNCGINKIIIIIIINVFNCFIIHLNWCKFAIDLKSLIIAVVIYSLLFNRTILFIVTINHQNDYPAIQCSHCFGRLWARPLWLSPIVPHIYVYIYIYRLWTPDLFAHTDANIEDKTSQLSSSALAYWRDLTMAARVLHVSCRPRNSYNGRALRCSECTTPLHN